VADVSRRGVLCALTAAGASVLGACRAREQAPRLISALPAGWSQGEEQWVTTTCGQCPAGCGIRVRVYEGRAVKIEGNVHHPVNHGGVGPKGQAGLQVLYHPDRIRGPLRRVGPRGAGRWTSISWETAIAEVAGELQRLRAAGQAHSLVVIDGEPRGVVPRLWERFLRAYGSPNHVTHGSTDDAGTELALTFMQGVSEMPAYDWQHTNYAIGFGVSLFESWCQTIHMARATAGMRRGTPGRRAKFVHVSPRFSVTAAKADEWVPIAPASYGALALGLAHVLIRDGLVDAEFIRDHTFGFENWRDSAGQEHRGFRDLVIADYPPDKVARITGVDVATIERLAREMSAHRPAIALGDGDAAGATNGLGTAMAIHALNALVGSIERRGGVLAHRPVLGSFSAFEGDEVARAGLQAERIDGAGTKDCPLGDGAIQNLPAAILSSRPYPINALVLYRSNPVFSKPEGTAWIDAIRKVPFVVSCSPLPDESTLWADFVLPDHTYLERAEIVEPAPSSGRPVIGLRQPVIAPRFNTMATADVVIRLARALPPVATAFPWTDSAGATAALLKDTPVDSDMRENGGWWGDQQFEQWDTALATPSRRFEFYSQTIASRLSALFTAEGELESYLVSCGVATRGDDLCLPHWEPAHYAGDWREYPFLLAPYRAINYAEGGVRHLPWLRELPSAGLFAWNETIELNPDDARRLDVTEGDAIRIESPAGTRRMHVRVHAGTPRGVVGLPLGHGPWPPTTADAGTAGGHGLLAALSDPLAGVFARQGTRVRLTKGAA
jgi:menaquinone reductase, molybdopterin-binding-like subunit